MRAFSSKWRVSGVKRLAVLGGDYKTGAMNLSSPQPEGAGVTAGRKRSASPVGGPSSPWTQRIPFRVDQASHCPNTGPHARGAPNTRSAEREEGVGAGREWGREAERLCDVWAHDSIITQPQSLRSLS